MLVHEASFEENFAPSVTAWDNLLRGTSELFAAPDGSAYAEVHDGEAITQDLPWTLEAGNIYTVTVWARSLNAHVPDRNGPDRGKQKAHDNVETAAFLDLFAGDYDSLTYLAEARVIVSPNASKGGDVQDDGANVWLDGGYRVHMGNTFLSQGISADPIDDGWTAGVDAEFGGMAIGPIVRPDGTLQIRAVGGTFYSDSGGFTSRIEQVRLFGSPPNYIQPEAVSGDEAGDIYETVLKNSGDESPWCIDAHYFYDEETGKLWPMFF